jgi:soluble lytic murein transglycosylase
MAAFLRGDLVQEAGRRAVADSLFGGVIDRWPASEYASLARFRLAAGGLARADTAAATRWYRAEVEARGSQQFAARYFLGGLEAARGDSGTARAEWRALAQADSVGYYGGLARERAGLALPVVAPPAVAGISRDLARALAELDALDRVGFREEADALVAWLVARDMSPEETLDLAEALITRRRPAQGINLGWRATRSLSLNHPRVLRAIYPWPLREVVQTEAAEFDLDPYLLAALIRQESSFDASALSRAGARGLMQLMPATARQAARRMGLDWSDQLLRVPDANIHVGAAHLSTLLRHYRGQVVPALAAYNAGLTPVERWRRRFAEARDPALFVERMPYAETRGYVRSVLRNWALYRVLYPPADPS